MSVTAQSIINEAGEDIGVIGVGLTMPGEETERALAALNTMIDGWKAERATVWALRDEQFTLPVAAASRTIGTGGQFNTDRPVRIEWAFLRVDGADYSLDPISQLANAAVAWKNTPAGWPCAFSYQPSVPLGVVHFLPPPSEEFELHLGTWSPLSSFATPGTAVDLPPGYKEALVKNLALRLAPKYDRSVSAEIATIAFSSLARIKRANHEPLTPRSSEVAFLASRGRGDIYSGQS